MKACELPSPNLHRANRPGTTARAAHSICIYSRLIDTNDGTKIILILTSRHLDPHSTVPQPRNFVHSLLPSLHRPARRDSIMSGSMTPTQLPQSQASLISSGIAGLFIHGIESGLVFSQFSQWFSASHRSESSLLSTVVVFVTLMGLCASTGHFTV